jgi:hypothetical protein
MLRMDTFGKKNFAKLGPARAFSFTAPGILFILHI